MKLLENLDTIISVICGMGSIVMFFLAKKEKDECTTIKNNIETIQTNIENHLKVTQESSEIKSTDTFNIDRVKTFDNRKSIK